MNQGNGRLARLDRSLQIAQQGGLSRRYGFLLVMFGVFLIIVNMYSLLFSAREDVVFSSGSALLGLSFIIWIAGYIIGNGSLGSITRLSCLLLLYPSAILLMASGTYMGLGFYYLVFMVLLVTLTLGLLWFLKKKGAGA
jgi:hypothetical protein